MNSIVDSILTMKMDVYIQQDTQDPDTGAMKKEWIYSRTVPCHAKGMITNTSSRSGDKQTIGNTYINQQTIEIRTENRITIREKITNIRDLSDSPIWTINSSRNFSPLHFFIYAKISSLISSGCIGVVDDNLSTNFNFLI